MTDRGVLAVGGASGGLALTVIGMFLSWSRIGGRIRSGFETADVAFALSDGGVPDIVEWIGRWWYAPPALLLVAWALTFAAGNVVVRILGVILSGVAIVLWVAFVWAGNNYGLFTVQWLGPIVSLCGALIITGFGALPRRSVLSA